MARRKPSRRKSGKNVNYGERQHREAQKQRTQNEIPLAQRAKALGEVRESKAELDAVNKALDDPKFMGAVAPTMEQLAAEFQRRYDVAIEMAEAADADPTPDRYYALLGYYEEFAKWMNQDPAVKGQTNHILKIKQLNETLLLRVRDRLKYFEEKYGRGSFDQAVYDHEDKLLPPPEEVDPEDWKEWAGWSRMWMRIQHDKGNRHRDVQELLAEDGLRLRTGHAQDGEPIAWTEPMREELDEPPPLAARPVRHSRWEEVVDLQDEMIRFWYTPFGRQYGQMWGQHMAISADDPTIREDVGSWANNLDAINRAMLQLANPIYVSPDVQDTIEYAAKHETFKMEPLAREDVFPNMHGFCVFPRPFHIKDKYDKVLAFRSMAWMPIGPNGEIAYDAEYRPKPSEASGVIIIAYSHREDPDDYPAVPPGTDPAAIDFKLSDLPIMTLCYVTPWTFHGVKKPTDLTGSNLAEFCSIIQTMWRFAKQTVIVPEGARLPRPERRRAERSGLQSDVVVIKLRRKKYAGSGVKGGERKIGKGFRYWVGLGEGGFWRNQYYPSTKTHQQIWIEPFLKGEEGAEIQYRPLHAFEITQ